VYLLFVTGEATLLALRRLWSQWKQNLGSHIKYLHVRYVKHTKEFEPFHALIEANLGKIRLCLVS